MRYAILVACEEYTDQPEVFYSYADAEEIRSTLIEYCDYYSDNVKYIQPFPGWGDTPNSIYQSVEDLFSKIQKDDTLLFYFAGHGYKSDSSGFLLLPDSKIDDLGNTAINIKILNDLFQRSGCDCFLILDACHSGVQARSILKSDLLLDTVPKDTGCVTIASCSANEESFPALEYEHGAFTYFFCRELKKAPINEDVLPEALKISVCTAVSDWAKRNSKVQTPTLIGQVVGNISVATRNAKAFDSTEDIIKDETLGLWKDVVKSWLRKNVALSVVNPLDVNKDWKVFGKLGVFEATTECGDEQWIILFTILERFNHADLIHAFSNLGKIKAFYNRFGINSHHKYLQLIVLKNKEACLLIDRPLSVNKKVQRCFLSDDVHSIILYLNRGNLIEYADNTQETTKIKLLQGKQRKRS